MERRSEKEDRKDSGSEISIVESIKKIAAHNARSDINTEQQLLLFLQSWWSRTYNRPLKDPLLMSYTTEELLYEFYDRVERTKAEKERLEQEDDKIEEDKERAAVDWAERMEKEEREAELRAEADKNESKPVEDPTKDPENLKWMEEQIQKAKEVFGEDFGEDIQENFDG